MNNKPDVNHPLTVTWRGPGDTAITLHTDRGVHIDTPKPLSRHNLVRLQTFLDEVHSLMEDGGVIEIPKTDPLPVKVNFLRTGGLIEGAVL